MDESVRPQRCNRSLSIPLDKTISPRFDFCFSRDGASGRESPDALGPPRTKVSAHPTGPVRAEFSSPQEARPEMGLLPPPSNCFLTSLAPCLHRVVSCHAMASMSSHAKLTSLAGSESETLPPFIQHRRRRRRCVRDGLVDYPTRRRRAFRTLGRCRCCHLCAPRPMRNRLGRKGGGGVSRAAGCGRWGWVGTRKHPGSFQLFCGFLFFIVFFKQLFRNLRRRIEDLWVVVLVPRSPGAITRGGLRPAGTSRRRPLASGVYIYIYIYK